MATLDDVFRRLALDTARAGPDVSPDGHDDDDSMDEGDHNESHGHKRLSKRRKTSHNQKTLSEVDSVRSFCYLLIS